VAVVGREAEQERARRRVGRAPARARWLSYSSGDCLTLQETVSPVIDCLTRQVTVLSDDCGAGARPPPRRARTCACQVSG